ncbi:MAG: NFACT RNA binding domain-containing protein [Nanoarchaeota archaeon]
MDFRKFITSSGKEVLAGKSAESNEKLIEQVSENEIVLHTAKPGSPFVNIKAGKEKITKKDLGEAAVFCARYSQVWKKAKIKKDVLVHWFLGKDIFKTKGMKLGTFGVKKVRKIKVNKGEILMFE